MSDDGLKRAFFAAWQAIKSESEPRGLTGRYKNDPTPTANLPDGWIWARQDGEGVPRPVRNINVRADRPDTPIRFELLDDGTYQIKGVDAVAGPEVLGAAASDYNQPDSHAGVKPNLTVGRDFYPGRPRIWQAGTLKINLSEPYPYIDSAGNPAVWTPTDANTLDISSNVPASAQQRYVQVALNPDATSPSLVAVNGTAQSLALPLAADAWKTIAVTAGYIRLDAVLLKSGDTDETTVTEERWKYGRIPAGGGGGVDASAVTYTPASGSDPGNVDGALDNLRSRVTTNESDIASLSSGGISSAGWVSLGQALVYGSADDPTYTCTCTGVDLTGSLSVGMKLRVSQTTGGTKYFFITRITFSTDTTLTLYGGTDYDLANETISSPYFSVVKAPFGFPLNPSKWTVEVTDTTQRSQANPTNGTWYNLGSLSITIPIGDWFVSYQVTPRFNDASTGTWDQYMTLSTANNTESDADFTDYMASGGAAALLHMSIQRNKYLTLTSKTQYFLNAKTGQTGLDSISIRNDVSKLFLRAVCPYL